jgi:hypothetical protein
MTWVILQNQLTILAQLASFTHVLENAYKHFCAAKKTTCSSKFPTFPIPYKKTDMLDPCIAIFSYLHSVLQLSISETNIESVKNRLPSRNDFLILYKWTVHNPNKSRVARITRNLCLLTTIISEYKTYVVNVYQYEERLKKFPGALYNQFPGCLAEKKFSKFQSKINIYVNLLNQELQQYLPRLIPSPALYRRQDLARQDTFVFLANLSICNKLSWVDFKQSWVTVELVPTMKKTLVSKMFSHFNHDITSILDLVIVNFAKQNTYKLEIYNEEENKEYKEKESEKDEQ